MTITTCVHQKILHVRWLHLLLAVHLLAAPLQVLLHLVLAHHQAALAAKLVLHLALVAQAVHVIQLLLVILNVPVVIIAVLVA